MRFSTIGGLAAAIGVTLAACAGDPPGERAARPLRVTTNPNLSNSALRIADREGYFAAQGVSIEWVVMNRPSSALPEVAAGQLDAIVGQVSVALFSIIGRGGRVRIVAGRDHHPLEGCSGGAIVLRRGLDPEHLPAALRVSATPALIEEFMLDRARELLGAAADDWKLTNLPSGSETVALAGGAVDLLEVNDPPLTRILDEGLGTVWRTFGQIEPEMQSHVLVFGPRLLDQDRDLGARFLAAYLAVARRLARGRTPENVASMAEAVDLDPELARRVCWPHVRPDLSVNHQSLATFQRWAVAKDLLDRVVPPEEYWDGDLAKAAVQRLDETAR